ncbi:uncharacterized protein TNCV_2275161 [Trichonephila clavipes]|nr:uncharacterized protein TNCV_2275161 [Trichonephila clavipes]
MLWLWETRGGIKSRCPTCNSNTSHRTKVATNHIDAYTTQTRSPLLTLINKTFCGIKVSVRADTGSSHSIAGERMYQVFKDKGLHFQKITLVMTLADDQQTTGEALTTQKEKLNLLLQSFQNVPKPEGEATTILEQHISALTPCNSDRVRPLIPLGKLGRPPKVPQTPGSSSGRRRNQRGRM